MSKLETGYATIGLKGFDDFMFLSIDASSPPREGKNVIVASARPFIPTALCRALPYGVNVSDARPVGKRHVLARNSTVINAIASRAARVTCARECR